MNGIHTLSSLKIIECRKVKTEIEKNPNQVITCISTNNITELNELIHAGVKLVREKIGVPLKSKKKKIKTRIGNSIGNAEKIHENRLK